MYSNVMQMPPYDIFPTLHSSRIILREITPSDLEDILEISVYDGKRASDTAAALEILQRIEQDYQNSDCVHWGIADKSSDVIMGSCGYYRGLQGGTGELGCVLRPAYKGKGFMTEAMQAAIDFGWQQMKLQHIIAITSSQNVKALALLERLHFMQVTDKSKQASIQRRLPELPGEALLYLLTRQDQL
jgi:ribosomal-protein-alanine N-acetyltransferase